MWTHKELYACLDRLRQMKESGLIDAYGITPYRILVGKNFKDGNFIIAQIDLKHGVTPTPIADLYKHKRRRTKF